LVASIEPKLPVRGTAPLPLRDEGGRTEGGKVQTPSSAETDRLVIQGDRRNGFERMVLAGVLDRSSVLVLEGELSAIMRTPVALILDLRGLRSIDRWGVHALDGATRHADRCGSRLFIVSQGLVLLALQAAGIRNLLSGADMSDLLESDGGAWTPVSLPPLPEQRTGGPLRVTEEAS
jgi:ABC-type transporter Mla MlaB component